MSSVPTPPATKPDQSQRILPAKPQAAAIVVLAFTAMLYIVELVDVALHHRLDDDGIVPRTLSGLDGIAWAPVLHGSWAHLLGNTLPVLIFGFLAMATGLARWFAVTVLIWLVSGIGVWLTAAPNTSTIGASGLAFGWLAYLLVRGVFNRSFKQLVVAVILLLIWGGTLWGLLPGNTGISWQAHAFGALGGILAAWLGARAGKSRARKAPTTLDGDTTPGSNLPE